MKSISIIILFTMCRALASDYKTGSKNCYDTPQVPSLSNSNTCVGLVADKASISWKMPRKILFINPNEAIVTALGSWSKNQGQIWHLVFSKGRLVSKQLLFTNTDRSHGLRLGPNNWIYYADATKVYKFQLIDPVNSQQIVIEDLPDSYTDLNNKKTESSHPLKEFIFLKNNDLVINIGAPSNDCSQEFRTHRACHQRDQQAELRKFKYEPATDTYSKSYEVIARGLRNSMGLLYNPIKDEIYQVENASDNPGTPDELNIVNPNELANSQDFGWPFCYGDQNIYLGYTNFRNFCRNTALSPEILFPAHAAPLDIMYYKGQMFPEYTDHIFVSWHGHRPSGSRIPIYSTDDKLAPSTEYSLRNLNIKEPLQLITTDWAVRSDGHPKGRPVGIDFNQEGAIFILDDVNAALLVVAKTTDSIGSQPTTTHYTDTINLPVNPIQDIATLITQDSIDQWSPIYNSVIQPLNCQTCHSEIFENSHTETLQNLIHNQWINLSSNRLADQLLWVRMTGHNGARIMPPYPSINILQDPTSLKSLEDWIKGF